LYPGKPVGREHSYLFVVTAQAIGTEEMIGCSGCIAHALCHEAEVIFGEAGHSRILAGDERKRFTGPFIPFELVLTNSNVVMDGRTGNAGIPGCFEEAKRGGIITTRESRVTVRPFVGVRMHGDQ
jgi:hypothetical protein